MATRSKKFRVATEGATVDGRKISRLHIEQMAKNYDPAVYTALVNLEHFKSVLPDSPFRRFGKVLSLSSEVIKGSMLDGKMGLYAVIEPNDDLIAMTGKGQKTFTSVEIKPSFADTGEAYLMGVAATDDPASLGTEVMQFRANGGQIGKFALNPEYLYSIGEETDIEFETVADEINESVDANKPQLFGKVRDLLNLFSKKSRSDDERFTDVGQAVELLATNQGDLAQRVDAFAGTADEVKQLTADNKSLTERFDAVEKLLDTTEKHNTQRPRATGGNGDAVTDC
ncbi:GPO family capsid scaffolding protein [Jeongeupia chitinilytica]|uniref:Phage capsid protein n=1 Tax=Jeongeupia chitinilytica TaxID=1041641 RepID=A0ABQ3H052_9NEIS|nr:GPO family capsid scaffolding protein [Jeongeupia chitinilytica]GHD59894.1 phage capsid protein [Jeongeupia chitinilytica]